MKLWGAHKTVQLGDSRPEHWPSDCRRKIGSWWAPSSHSHREWPASWGHCCWACGSHSGNPHQNYRMLWSLKSCSPGSTSRCSCTPLGRRRRGPKIAGWKTKKYNKFIDYLKITCFYRNILYENDFFWVCILLIHAYSGFLFLLQFKVQYVGNTFIFNLWPFLCCVSADAIERWYSCVCVIIKEIRIGA